MVFVVLDVEFLHKEIFALPKNIQLTIQIDSNDNLIPWSRVAFVLFENLKKTARKRSDACSQAQPAPRTSMRRTLHASKRSVQVFAATTSITMFSRSENS
ncbi:MAG: hypothetical protein Ta2A_07270 [Treponemataceae bacterium]|nr:MAG: hypothetical protein Ta2A_07270 [Treponemataceae bacterium]